MEKDGTFQKLLFDDRIKPKNVLALNEKVAAIRCYEVEPVYKKIGRMFNCSPDQIKRIIKQKNEIMAEWENRTKKSPAPTSNEIKTVRVSVLGKAVHEWIRRIMYYTDFNLNDTLIQTMALEFSKVLQMGKFYPNEDWIKNFRATYNLPDANTKTMSIGYQESHSVQIRDILRYVKETCGTNDAVMADDKPKVDCTVINAERISDLEVEEIKTESDCTDLCSDVIKIEEEKCQPSCSAFLQDPVSPEKETIPTKRPKILMENDSEEINHPSLPVRSPPQLEVTIEEPKPEKFAIYTHKAAISCVKLLEEFALLKENFRLIGLIERLEESLNEKSKQN